MYSVRLGRLEYVVHLIDRNQTPLGYITWYNTSPCYKLPGLRCTLLIGSVITVVGITWPIKYMAHLMHAPSNHCVYADKSAATILDFPDVMNIYNIHWYLSWCDRSVSFTPRIKHCIWRVYILLYNTPSPKWRSYHMHSGFCDITGLSWWRIDHIYKLYIYELFKYCHVQHMAYALDEKSSGVVLRL